MNTTRVPIPSNPTELLSSNPFRCSIMVGKSKQQCANKPSYSFETNVGTRYGCKVHLKPTLQSVLIMNEPMLKKSTFGDSTTMPTMSAMSAMPTMPTMPTMSAISVSVIDKLVQENEGIKRAILHHQSQIERLFEMLSLKGKRVFFFGLLKYFLSFLRFQMKLKKMTKKTLDRWKQTILLTYRDKKS